jgi:hypothetical protein
VEPRLYFYTHGLPAAGVDKRVFRGHFGPVLASSPFPCLEVLKMTLVAANRGKVPPMTLCRRIPLGGSGRGTVETGQSGGGPCVKVGPASPARHDALKTDSTFGGAVTYMDRPTSDLSDDDLRIAAGMRIAACPYG